MKGVTGAGHLDVADVKSHLSRIREHSQLPLAVGFGIKDAASAAAVANVADGVVVGSALIHAMAEKLESGASEDEAANAAVQLLAEIRAGVDSAAS